MSKFVQCIHQTIVKYWLLIILCLIIPLVSNAVPDEEQPVNIQSDLATFDHATGIAIYTGNVLVDQGSRHLAADKLTIKRDNKNQIKIMIATGNPATFRSQADINKPVGSGKAKIIKYYPQTDTVDLLQNAELTQNGDTISGPVLKYNFASGQLKSKSTKNQRATFILQPRRETK